MTFGEALAALKDPRFAWFFAARTVSTAGGVMAPVALAFAVLHVDTSAGALAQVLGVRTAVMVLFLLVGGVISDRFSRITVLQISHLLTFLTQGLAATLVITGHATLTQLTIIEGINGAVSAFTMPAMMGIVPLLVPRTHLQQANSLLSFSRSGLGIIGPALAGILVVTVGPGWALGIDAISYLLAILCLANVRLDRQEKKQLNTKERVGMLTELKEGWGEFVSRDWLWIIVAAFGILNAIHVGVIAVIGPLIAKTTPSLGESGWGLVLSAEALGTVVITIVMLRLRLAHPLRVGMLAVALVAVPIGMLGLDAATVPLAIAFFIAGAGVEVFAVGWDTALQEHIPVTVLSRIASYDSLGSLVAVPVGTFVYGWLAVVVPLRTLLLVSAALYAVLALATLFSRSVRDLGRADLPAEAAAHSVP